MSTDNLLLDLSNELLRNGQSVRFSAPGRSMYPTIREGAPITVQPVSPSAVQKGDIILYRWRQGVIAHRIVEIENPKGESSRFVLRGDASGACAESVIPEQILGKVVAVDRGGRRIDLYSLRSKIERMLRPWASRCKKWVIR